MSCGRSAFKTRLSVQALLLHTVVATWIHTQAESTTSGHVAAGQVANPPRRSLFGASPRLSTSWSSNETIGFGARTSSGLHRGEDCVDEDIMWIVYHAARGETSGSAHPPTAFPPVHPNPALSPATRLLLRRDYRLPPRLLSFQHHFFRHDYFDFVPVKDGYEEGAPSVSAAVSCRR
jgi:hypothetical protein